MSHLDTSEHPVVLFDGVCNLCNGTIQFVIPRDSDGTLRFAPLQSEVGAELLADCGYDTDHSASIVLIDDGECYTRSDAVLQIARYMDGNWPKFYHFRVVPRLLRNAVYDLVARYRYVFFGRKDRCMVPSADVEPRFLAESET